MPYDPKVPNCFGDADYQFAILPLDQERAFQWLTELRRSGVPWAEAKQQIQEYLREKKVEEIKIAAQVDRARKMLGLWLPGEAEYD